MKVEIVGFHFASFLELWAAESFLTWHLEIRFPIRSLCRATTKAASSSCSSWRGTKRALAQTAAAPRMQDALSDIEDALGDHLAALTNAAEDDKADAEAAGDVGRSWRPLRAA